MVIAGATNGLPHVRAPALSWSTIADLKSAPPVAIDVNGGVPINRYGGFTVFGSDSSMIVFASSLV